MEGQSRGAAAAFRLSGWEMAVHGGELHSHSEFKRFLTFHSIIHNAAAVSVSAKGFTFGTSLPGFNHLQFSYGRTCWGLFGKEDGYLYEGELCNTGNDCLQALFFEQDQSKARRT